MRTGTFREMIEAKCRVQAMLEELKRLDLRDNERVGIARVYLYVKAEASKREAEYYGSSRGVA